MDVSGQVYFDNAEFVEAYKEYDSKMMKAKTRRCRISSTLTN
ncbi:MAG: hypothetical protein ACLS7Z_02780 [Christensenellales bacterium]